MLCTDKRGSSWRSGTVEKLLVRKSILHKGGVNLCVFSLKLFFTTGHRNPKASRNSRTNDAHFTQVESLLHALFHVKHARK